MEDADLALPDESLYETATISGAPISAAAANSSGSSAVVLPPALLQPTPEQPPTDGNRASGKSDEAEEEEQRLQVSTGNNSSGVANGLSSAGLPTSPNREAWGGPSPWGKNNSGWRSKDGARKPGGGQIGNLGGSGGMLLGSDGQPVASAATQQKSGEVILDKLYNFKSKAPQAKDANAAAQSTAGGRGELRHLDQSLGEGALPVGVVPSSPRLRMTPPRQEEVRGFGRRRRGRCCCAAVSCEGAVLRCHAVNTASTLHAAGHAAASSRAWRSSGIWVTGARPPAPAHVVHQQRQLAAAAVAQSQQQQQAQAQQQQSTGKRGGPPPMILPPSIAQSGSSNEPASPPATSGFAASRSGVDVVARPPSILAGAEDGNLLLQPASTTPAAPSFSSSVPRYSKEAAAEASRALDALGTALDASLIKACASAVLDFMIAELELSVQQNGNGSMMNGHRSSAHEMNGGVVDGDAGEVEPGMRSSLWRTSSCSAS